MNDELKIRMIANVFKQLENTLHHTGFSLAFGREDTLNDDIIYVYDEDRFIGAIKTTIFNDFHSKQPKQEV